MIPLTVTSAGKQLIESDRLQQRLTTLGLAVAWISDGGSCAIDARDGSAENLLGRSVAFRQAIKEHLSEMHTSPQQPVRLWPGVWCVSLSPQRRRRKNVDNLTPVVFLITESFLTSDQMRLVCDELKQDYTAVCQYIRRERLFHDHDVLRVAQLIEWMSDDVAEIDRRSSELQSVTRELADSYEELSMLYKLSCSMTVNQPIKDFLNESCQELQQVVNLSWMALQLDANKVRMQDYADLTVLSGLDSVSKTSLAVIGNQLLNHAIANGESTVVDDVGGLGIAGLDVLATSLLVVPLKFDDELIGVLFGGDKSDGSPTTSNDAKLCSSLANSLAIFLQNSWLYEDMQAMFMGTLKALTVSIDAKDSYTFGHTERVAALSRQLALGCGFEPAFAERIYLSGLLHDVGKIGVPEAVLAKPGKLTNEEYDLIKLHPEIGERILHDIPQMDDLIPGVLYHHERWDGRGYPHGLSGHDIPLFGRLLAIADAFDAMSSNRTYRSAMPHEQVLQQIRDCRGTQFDPALADVFLKLDFSDYFAMARRHKSEADQQG